MADEETGWSYKINRGMLTSEVNLKVLLILSK